MGTKFIDYQSNQLYLLPQNPEEWLGKTLPSIAHDKKLTKRMAKKLKSKKAKKLYKKGKAIVEPVYIWIKQVLGFKKFSIRG